MIKFSSIICSLICGVAFINVALAQPQDNTVIWEIIPDTYISRFSIYIDKKNLSRQQTDKLDTSTGSFLVVPKEGPLKFKRKDGEFISALSVVRAMVVDCKTGNAIPLIDLYFDVEIPTKDSKPIIAVDYRSSMTASAISTKGALFKTFCPAYI